MGVLQLDGFAQTLVFTGGGVGLTGNVLHLGNLGFENLVFRFQGLIFEHIAVVAFHGIGQGGGGGPERGQQALDYQVRYRLVGQTGHNGKGGRNQYDQHQNNSQFGTKELLHACCSSIHSGAICFRTCPRAQTGSPITL